MFLVRLASAAFAVSAVFISSANAQTVYNWNGSGVVGTPQWLTAGNWSAGAPGGLFPGVAAGGLPGQGTATDVARINSFPDGISNGLGIDFGAAGGQLSVGAIHLAGDGIGGLGIGNTSTTTPGILRLNGATIAGIPNVVIGDTGESYNAFYFQNTPYFGGTDATMSIMLGGAENVFLTRTSYFTFFVPIIEAVPGANVTIRGGNAVDFLRPNAYSGRTLIAGSTLNANQDRSLGVVPTAPTPGSIVLEPDAITGPGVLSTNGSSFTLHQNRGIAIGATSGTSDGILDIQDVEVPDFISTIIYNGVITNNGGGTGRLVKTGGGKLVLGGANTYTGGTLHQGGELRLTNVNALGTTGTVTISPRGVTQSGFAIPGNLFVEATGSFSRPIIVTYTGTSNRPVTIGTPDITASGETVFSGAILLDRAATIQGGNSVGTRFTGGIAGAGAVTITGTAAGRVVEFAGNNFTYTGGTTVASGTLLVNNQTDNQSGTGTGAVSVTGGTLGGNGRIAGAVSVASTGRITAGTSLVTTNLTLDSTLAIDGGKYRVVLFGSGNHEASRLDVAGTVSLTNSPMIELDLNGQTVDGLRAGGPRSFTVVISAGVSGTFAPANFTALGFEASEWTVSYPDGVQVLLYFTPVPEPGAMLAIAGVACWGWRRRCRS